MDCLIIKKQHLNKIFSGEKTWELRGSRTHKRGIIGLIESGSGEIKGTCELIDCVGPLDVATFLAHKDKHCSVRTAPGYQKTYGWVLRYAKRYAAPKKYSHPQGAIIWVKV